VEAIRREAGLEAAGEPAPGDNLPLALAGWTLGCAAIWAAIFAVGNFCYGRMGLAWGLTAITAVTCAGLVRVVRRVWRPAAGEGG